MTSTDYTAESDTSSTDGKVSKRPRMFKKLSELFVDWIDSGKVENIVLKGGGAVIIVLLAATALSQQIFISGGSNPYAGPSVQPMQSPAEPSASVKKDTFLKVYADDVPYTDPNNLAHIYVAAKSACADLDAGKTLMELRADWVANPRPGDITPLEIASVTRDAIVTLCPAHLHLLQSPLASASIMP